MGASQSALLRERAQRCADARAAAHAAYAPAAPAPAAAALLLQPATAQAAALAARAVTAVELTRAAIARCHAVGYALNAITEELYASALEAAAASDARRAAGAPPLSAIDGLPVSIKDVFEQRGCDTTLGLAVRTLQPAAADGLPVALLRAAGAVLLVRSNVPQCLMLPESDNFIFGRSVNPYSAARTPGGSSGGEGALLAAHCSALGLGSDIGGSLRIPAAFCGVAGFKPTPERVTALGAPAPRPRALGSLDGQPAVRACAGPMARCVRDLELLAGVLMGPAATAGLPGVCAGDATLPRQPWSSAAFAAAAARRGSARPLRFAVWGGGEAFDGFWTPAPACARAVREAAAALRAAGHEALPWSPASDDGLDTAGAAVLFYALMGADGALASFKSGLEGEALHPNYALLDSLASIPDFLRPAIGAVLGGALGWTRAAALLTSARARSALEYWELCRAQGALRRALVAAVQARGFDAILCPAMGVPAFLHGQSKDLTPACSPLFFWNLVGFPALVLPCSVQARGEGAYEAPRGQRGDPFHAAAVAAVAGAEGMPVGVQLAGLPFEDEALLGAGVVLEEALAAAAAAAQGGAGAGAGAGLGAGVPPAVLAATLAALRA